MTHSWICLLQEPLLNKHGPSNPPPGYTEKYCPPNGNMACIRSIIWPPLDLAPTIIYQLSSPDMAVGRISIANKSILLASLYFPHNECTYKHTLIPDQMLAPLAGHNLRSALLSLAGDLNSNSLLWNSPHTCPRGKLIESFVLANDLVKLNQPSLTPPINHLCMKPLLMQLLPQDHWQVANLICWEPLDIDTFGSDHRGLFFKTFQCSRPRLKPVQIWTQTPGSKQ